MEIFINLIFIPFALLINYFIIKKNFLVNYSGQNHQLYTAQKNVPISGGIILLIFFLINYQNYNLIFIIWLVVFFIIGILGDLNLIKVTSIRFMIQIIFIVLFVHYYSLNIIDLRIEFLNYLLTNIYVNYFFTCFCILVFVNGSNFIDGNNTLSIGYFIILLISFLYLSSIGINLIFDSNFLLSFLVVLIILFIFNAFNKM